MHLILMPIAEIAWLFSLSLARVSCSDLARVHGHRLHFAMQSSRDTSLAPLILLHTLLKAISFLITQLLTQ